MNLRVILTGATGMVGEGVLYECLAHPEVESVLIINRKPAGLNHPKLKEIVHQDFFDLSPIADQLAGYNACLFCLGVSSVGLKEPEYYRLTYTLTMNFARTLANKNMDLTFCYISGKGTDSSEKGRMMWARVKGKTENDLAHLGFKRSYAFRPGLLKPGKGSKNVLKLYKVFGWLYPVIKGLFPNSACSIKELGLAMIRVASNGFEKNVLEVKDILKIARDR
jgi:hypothetical protein